MRLSNRRDPREGELQRTPPHQLRRTPVTSDVRTTWLQQRSECLTSA